jgi:hypothetical protein
MQLGSFSGFLSRKLTLNGLYIPDLAAPASRQG